jgi:hypothetical protein
LGHCLALSLSDDSANSKRLIYRIAYEHIVAKLFDRRLVLRSICE